MIWQGVKKIFPLLKINFANAKIISSFKKSGLETVPFKKSELHLVLCLIGRSFWLLDLESTNRVLLFYFRAWFSMGYDYSKNLGQSSANISMERLRAKCWYLPHED